MQGFGFGIWGCVVFIVRLVAAVLVVVPAIVVAAGVRVVLICVRVGVCTEFATVVGENSVAVVVIVVVSL